QALKDKGVIDSGCSRHMTGNISYLSDFKEINGGYVAFGGNPKGGKIIGKGKIRTCKLDFDDVYFVKELKFNLFSVSQMYDKKNNVLFTDTECVVLSSDFKLPDENHVLLSVLRENNMCNVDLKNIVPSGDLTCLFTKATLYESNFWHRRLGHINFKTMNKLVKGNLVRGLPLKVFENNHTYGPKASKSVSVDTSNEIKKALDSSIIEDWVSDSDEDEYEEMILNLENVQHKPKRNFAPIIVLTKSGIVPVSAARQSSLRVAEPVSAARPINTGAFKPLGVPEDALNDQGYFDSGGSRHMTGNISYLTDFKEHDGGYIAFGGGAKGGKITGKGNIKTGIKREYNVARTPQQNKVAERRNRTLIKATKTMLVDSKLPTTFWAEAVNTACYVQNRTSWECLMGNQMMGSLLATLQLVKLLENTTLGLASPNKDKHDASRASKSDNQKRPNVESSTKIVNTAGLVNTATPTYDEYPNDPLMPDLEDFRIFDDAYDDRDEGA
nr:ribonuclease H-like domain-containing protein [Tanacetum cinerariifolium]